MLLAMYYESFLKSNDKNVHRCTKLGAKVENIYCNWPTQSKYSSK